jgi:hypothetical protein
LTKNATHFLSFAKRRLRSAKREQEKIGCAPSRLGRHGGAQVNKYQERLHLSVEMKGITVLSMLGVQKWSTNGLKQANLDAAKQSPSNGYLILSRLFRSLVHARGFFKGLGCLFLSLSALSTFDAKLFPLKYLISSHCRHQHAVYMALFIVLYSHVL